MILKERLEGMVQRGKAEFKTAHPFEHLVFDDFLDADVAASVLSEFHESATNPSGTWEPYKHYNESKRGLSDLAQMGPVTRDVFAYLHSETFVKALEEMTGIDGLLSDPDMDGAGIYEMPRGGFLNLHIDFLAHRRRKSWSRQLNLLVYLNPNWHESYNGQLELWSMNPRQLWHKVLPVFNRAVLFHTSVRALHGVPEIVTCPETDARKNIALYYYKDEGKHCATTPTDYQARPNDSRLKKFLVAVDRMAVAAYSYVQRDLGVSQEVLIRIRKMLSR